MDANILQKCLNEGLTQRQIGARLGCSQTNIKYWVKVADV